MKVITCQADLDHALRTIAPAVGHRSSHPILDCCLIQAAGGTMTVTGFNLDLGIICTIPAAVETDGAVALPYRLLAGLASRFESDEALTLADGALTAAKQLLQGIHLGSGHMEATDGHRLMRYAIDLPADLNVVLPASTMRLLQDRVATIAVAKGQAVIDAGDGITIYSRILDGSYPDVAKLVPDAFKHTITVNRHRFNRALERVAIIADAHNSIVKLMAASSGLEISAEADANNGRELLAVEGTATGTWAFNVHYLLDGIKAFKPAEAITIHANTATTPVVLTPAGRDGVTYLVMPVQVRS
jgi:DNA polymerase-3 subunit beta